MYPSTAPLVVAMDPTHSSICAALLRGVVAHLAGAPAVKIGPGFGENQRKTIGKP